jgi:hypothetical protein
MRRALFFIVLAMAVSLTQGETVVRASSFNAAGAYYIDATVPAFGISGYFSCKARIDGPVGQTWTLRAACYTAATPSFPIHPPPYVADNVITSQADMSGGVLKFPIYDCFLGTEIDLEMHFYKSGSPTGGIRVIEDTSNPIDCNETGTLTPFNNFSTLSLSTDTDGDNCADYNELGPNQLLGGLRDPFNKYDFPDFNPTSPYSNKQINVFDTQQIAFRVEDASWAEGGGIVQYYDYYDRSQTPIGPNAWNLGPPETNGSEIISYYTDLAQGMYASYGANCN